MRNKCLESNKYFFMILQAYIICSYKRKQAISKRNSSEYKAIKRYILLKDNIKILEECPWQHVYLVDSRNQTENNCLFSQYFLLAECE